MQATIYINLLLLCYGVHLIIGRGCGPTHNKDAQHRVDVQISDCHVKHNGKCFNPECWDCVGAMKMELTNKCTPNSDLARKRVCCVNGKLEATFIRKRSIVEYFHMEDPVDKSNPSNYGVCELYGNPYIHTFDDFHYSVQSNGEFTISMSCNTDDWAVNGKVDNPYEGAAWTRLVEVAVLTHETQIIITTDGIVTVDGNEVAVGRIQPSPNVYIYKTGSTFNVHLISAEVLVIYNVESMSLRVIAGKRWFRETCGLCGNWNGRISDDENDVSSVKPAKDCPLNDANEMKCRYDLERIIVNCKEDSVNRYLLNCMMDMCVGGEEAARSTLEAAKEYCALDVNKAMAEEFNIK